ncbi:MAG: DUF3102 domain-containing protein [Desulfovibrionaceae bacterium]
MDTQISEICQLHGEIIEAGKTVLMKAIRVGEILTEAKASLPHGQFTPWLKNLPFTDRTARNYMRLYQNRDQLKTETVSGLTAAYRALAPAVEDHPTTSDVDVKEMVSIFFSLPKQCQDALRATFKAAYPGPVTHELNKLCDMACGFKPRKR